MTHQDDEGFTLVELLLASVILAVISGVLAAAFIVTFRTTDEANERLGLAHDVQISTALFAPFAQSAEEVFAGDPPSAALAGGLCGPGAAELSFVWAADAATGLYTEQANYHVVGNRLELHRCGAGGTRNVTLSSFVSNASAPQCGTGACTAAAQAPPTVSWALTDTAGATHTLYGARRTHVVP